MTSGPFRMSVTADIKAVQSQMANLQQAVRDQAIQRAINRTADQAKAAAVRDIRQTYNLTAEFVRDRIRVSYASAKGIRIEAKLVAPGKRSMNLIRFMERQVTLAQNRRRKAQGRQGVYVQVRRGGAKQLIPGAFVVSSFRRNQGDTKTFATGFLARRSGRSRYPIEALQTVDVPQLMLSQIGAAHLKRVASEVFPKRLAYEIGLAIKRAGLAPR
jgi:hypothetical protein